MHVVHHQQKRPRRHVRHFEHRFRLLLRRGGTAAGLSTRNAVAAAAAAAAFVEHRAQHGTPCREYAPVRVESDRLGLRLRLCAFGVRLCAFGALGAVVALVKCFGWGMSRGEDIGANLEADITEPICVITNYEVSKNTKWSLYIGFRTMSCKCCVLGVKLLQ